MNPSNPTSNKILALLFNTSAFDKKLPDKIYYPVGIKNYRVIRFQDKEMAIAIKRNAQR